MTQVNTSISNSLPETLAQLLREAMIALRAGDIQAALQFADDARSSDASAPAMIVFAAIAHAAGRDIDALAILDRAMQLAPEVGNYPDAAAAILLKMGRKADGIFNLKLGTYLSSDPFIDEIIGDYFGKIKDIFDSFIENRPLVAAQLMMTQGLYHAAVQQLETYIGVSGGDSESFALIIESAIHAGLLKHAEMGLAALLALAPDHPKLGCYSLAIAAMQGDMPKAKEIAAMLARPTTLDEALDLYQLAAGTPIIPHEVLELANTLIAALTEKAPDVEPFVATSPFEIPLSIGFVCGNISPALEHFLASIKNLINIKIYILGTEVNQSLRRLKASIEDVREVASIDDATLVEMIRSDNISTLIDCVGAGRFSRPTLWKTRMAPIQILWPLYSAYDNVEFYDYRILSEGEVIADDPRVIDLNTPLFYPVPPAELMGAIAEVQSIKVEREVDEQSALRLVAAHPSSILLDETLEVYFSILKIVQNATLSFVANSDIQDPLVVRILRIAEKYQCADRIELIDPSHFRTSQHEILLDADLILDSFPFGNVDLVMDCLWIGAPVLTLSGQGGREYLTSSLVRLSGVPELVAASGNDFIRIAIEFLESDEARVELRQKILKNQKELRPEVYVGAANALVKKIQSLQAN